MSKKLIASCEGGKVTIEDLEIVATILSEGVAQSSGIALVEQDVVTYLTSNASDIKLLITKSLDAIEKIANVLTAIGGGMTGPTTAPPPTLATDVAAITAIATELSQLKDNLK